MTFTYTEKPVMTTPPAAEVDFVPAYARRPAKQKKFQTWMVLAPIGAIALLGGAAAMLATPGADEPAPLAEPAAVTAATLNRTAPLPTTMSSPPIAAATPAPVIAAPVARDPAPVRRAAPMVRAAPVERAAPAAPRVEIPAQPTGPRAYSPATTSLNVAPTPSAATPAPPPAITVQPLS